MTLILQLLETLIYMYEFTINTLGQNYIFFYTFAH